MRRVSGHVIFFRSCTHAHADAESRPFHPKHYLWQEEYKAAQIKRLANILNAIISTVLLLLSERTKLIICTFTAAVFDGILISVFFTRRTHRLRHVSRMNSARRARLNFEQTTCALTVSPPCVSFQPCRLHNLSVLDLFSYIYYCF